MKTLWKTGFLFGSVVAMITVMILLQQLPAGGERNMERTNTLKRTEIPPIDRKMPFQVETATFALG
jgi:hypothetical protein